jgi:hypothetical protein
MKDIKDIENLGTKKINLLSSEALDNSIKNLTNPRFLGSIHMRKLNDTSRISTVESLLSGELELKVNKSLKNTLLNPITIALIFLMIIFNILWVLLVFFL